MWVLIQRIIDKYCGPFVMVGLFPFRVLKKRPKNINSIAVVRLWAIGEAILTLPLIKRLKQEYPKAEITVICRSQVKGVFENQKFVDKVEVVSPKLFGNLNKYDVAIDTEPYLNLASIISFWMGRFPVGYSNKFSRILNLSNISFNDKIHAADNFLRLGKVLGINQKKLTELVKLPTDKQSEQWVKGHMRKWKSPIIGVCPTAGASAKSREWQDKRWIELLQYLKKYKPTIVFVTSKDNLNKIRTLQESLDFKTFDTTSLNLQKSFALVAKLDMMISIDTGPMHFAAAQGVPTIGLFCPNTPQRFGPLGKKNSYVYKPVLSRPCINVHKGQIPSCEGHGHMSNITVNDVIKEVEKLNKKWKIL